MEYADLIGVPFAYGGRTVQGLDCYGLLMICYARRGIQIPDPYVPSPATWGQDNQQADPAGWLADHWGNWTRCRPFPGCAVAISRFGHVVDHVAVYLSGNELLHTLEKTGVVVSSLNAWSLRVVGTYDYRPVQSV